jgi:fructose-1-phosphate kinase PfkB-like protein
VVCSGSSPCAQTDQTYARIIALAQQNGCKTYLDSYGAAFREALRVRPTVVQCNRTELSAGLEKSLKGEQDLLDALAKVIEAGVQLVLVTDGPRSAYAADGEKIWRVIPPAVEAINPTGSGDCVVAGMLKELSAGHPVESGLRYGAAAGGVNATRWEVATVSLQEVEELLSEVRVEQIT